MPAVRSRPKKGSRPRQSQTQKPQSIEAEKFIDIGMCVLVCDWKVKPLLEHMLAHEFFEMPAKEVAGLAGKLPEHMHDDKRKRLSEKLKKPDLGQMKAKKLKEYIRHTLRWSLYELQCVVEAMGKDSDRLVEKLRETRDSLVDKYRKFKDKSERDTFWETYNKFINNFGFRKYFNSSRNTKREECLQLSLDYTDLVKMLSEYDKLEKTLRKEIADWEEHYKKQLEALEAKWSQLKEQVETLEKQLEGEKVKRKLLEAKLSDKQHQLSDKDKKIDRLKQQLAEVTEQLRETEETLRSEREVSKAKDETIRMLEEKQAGVEHDVSERDDTIAELNQKLVDIVRERIILQNYFYSQTGGKAGDTNINVKVSGKVIISHHSSHTTSLALFGVATDGWEQFHDIALCVVAFDCKLKSLFELLLATSITTDNAIQVLFDSDDENNLEKALWHSKPKAEKQLKYLEKAFRCIDDGFLLHGCTREELIFLINAVNDALTKFIEIKQVNLSEFNRLRNDKKSPKASPRDEVPETPQVDEVPEMPQVDEVPEMPQVDEVRETPQADEVRETPQVDEVPETPQVDEVPETPLVDEVPETPQVDEVRETPQVDEVPETPQVDEVRETPQLDEVRETPQVDEVRETPQVDEVPETPQVDEVPETPQVDEKSEKSSLDEKCKKLSKLLKKLLNTEPRIKVFRTALMLHFVQERKLDAQLLHKCLRKVKPADLFKDTDKLFKDADTLRIMRNDIVHTKFWFPEAVMRNNFLEAYEHVIKQMEFRNIYPLSDPDEVKEAYLLPNVTWGEMTDVTIEYERVRQLCMEQKQELKEKKGHICELESQIQKDREKIQEQEKQIEEKDEQIRKLEKESRGMTRVHEQNVLNFVQDVRYVRLSELEMEPEAFPIRTHQRLPHPR